MAPHALGMYACLLHGHAHLHAAARPCSPFLPSDGSNLPPPLPACLLHAPASLHGPTCQPPHTWPVAVLAMVGPDHSGKRAWAGPDHHARCPGQDTPSHGTTGQNHLPVEPVKEISTPGDILVSLFGSGRESGYPRDARQRGAGSRGGGISNGKSRNFMQVGHKGTAECVNGKTGRIC
jgi:hypothetical protein